MSRIVIDVKNVTMRFHINADKMLSLKEFITRKIKGQIQYFDFVALKNISFSVQRGEIFGLIGHNGAGKSTLLKTIAKILKPTTGEIKTHGKIVPMLELGSGFDGDLTGRENIFLNGAILGYDEKFLIKQYEKIVEFSGLGDFINVPIRNYSSGMLSRLSFSVASMVKPEILIIDEILSVGDADFRVKSRSRMNELMSGGTTVLLVSHDVKTIRETCNRVLWLEHGKIKMIGEAQEVCDAYEAQPAVLQSDIKGE